MAERFAVVMAGGSGTRFWPASRAAHPKQFLKLAGSSESLLQATVRRVSAVVGADRVLVVTNARHAQTTAEQLPQLRTDNLLLEPVGRNTAPCIAWAAAVVLQRAPDAVMAVVPADSHVGDDDAYRSTLERALLAAEGGELVTIGVQPNRPETGYGYVEVGAPIAPGVQRVSAFVEKPDLERAKAYLASGKHLWNSGMFFFRADSIAAAIARCMPELGDFVRRFAACPSPDRDALIEREFASLPAVSIDYGVMEKEPNIAVVPGDFGWDDVGSWAAGWQLSQKDESGNAAQGEALFVDAHNNFASAPPRKLIALLGVSDLVVVDTPDALLVMPRERAQDVRRVIEALQSSGRKHHL